MVKSFDLNVLLRDAVRKLKPYRSARDEFDNTNVKAVYLDANENPWQSVVNRYPDPRQMTLKKVIAELKNYPVDSLLLGNGSDECIDLLFRAFCEPKNDEIVVFQPTYGMYEVSANIHNVTIKELMLNDYFLPDVNQLKNSLNKNTKLVFLCDPNNPSGNRIPISLLEDVLATTHCLVILDEAYVDFSADGSRLSLLRKYPNLVILQTFSKAWGMAGIRLGMLWASPDIVSALNKVKAPYNINVLTQNFALEKIHEFAPKLNVIVAQIIEEREKLTSFLSTCTSVKQVFPSEANFLLVKVNNANYYYEKLKENGVIVRNRTSLPNLENCLRVTIGTPEENNCFMNAMLKLETNNGN